MAILIVSIWDYTFSSQMSVNNKRPQKCRKFCNNTIRWIALSMHCRAALDISLTFHITSTHVASSNNGYKTYSSLTLARFSS